MTDNEDSPASSPYSDGDVVWVKFGANWWPGEVKDFKNLPPDLVVDFKKPPLLTVKFFDEDSYEYVKNWTNVYPFNCERKIEFIRKGMAAVKSKVGIAMEKFPKDVTTAEVRTGGNSDILNEPIFTQEKKKIYPAAEVFGTPSPKIKNKDKRKSGKSAKESSPHVTHRRFLGLDDYKAYVCIQYPGKDRVPGDREDDEVIRINREPEQEFKCHTCDFRTGRLAVMVLHTKSHIRGLFVPSQGKGKKPAARKGKKEPKKRWKLSNEAARDSSESSGTEIAADGAAKEKRKRKRRTEGGAKWAKLKKKAAADEEIGVEPKDITKDLLAEWDDGSSEGELDSSKGDLDLDRSRDLFSETDEKMGDDSLNEDEDKENGAKEETVDAVEESLEAGKITVGSREDPVDSKKGSVDSLKISVDSGKKSVDTGKKSVDSGQDSEDSRKDSVGSGKDSLDSKKDSAESKKESAVLKKESANSKKESEDSKKDSVDLKKDSVDSKKKSVDSRKRSLDSRKVDSVDSKKGSVDSLKESVDSRKKSVDSRKKSVDSRKEPEDSRKETVDSSKKSPDSRKLSMDSKKESVDSKKGSLDTADSRKKSVYSRKDSSDSKSDSVDSKKESSNFKKDSLTCKKEYVAFRKKSTDSKKESAASRVSEKEKVHSKKMDKETQEAIKSCFDFDEDEDEEESSMIAKPVSEGRKIPRVIPLAEKRKSVDRHDDMEENEKAKEEVVDEEAFKELMEITAVPELPDEVRNSLKCEQNFHKAKTIKFPDKDGSEEGSSSPKVRKKDSSQTEVATKLTNPKKRFVKSFEDFEQMQNEMRKKEEEESTKGEPSPSSSSKKDKDKASTIEFAKLKSQIMSKIIEEVNRESSKEKVGESPEKKVQSGPKSPRIKILEIYKKEEETVKTEQSPKKGKWSRRGSHPKKDKNFIVTAEDELEQLKIGDKSKKSEDETGLVEAEKKVEHMELKEKESETNQEKVSAVEDVKEMDLEFPAKEHQESVPEVEFPKNENENQNEKEVNNGEKEAVLEDSKEVNQTLNEPEDKSVGLGEKENQTNEEKLQESLDLHPVKEQSVVTDEKTSDEDKNVPEAIESQIQNESLTESNENQNEKLKEALIDIPTEETAIEVAEAVKEEEIPCIADSAVSSPKNNSKQTQEIVEDVMEIEVGSEIVEKTEEVEKESDDKKEASVNVSPIIETDLKSDETTEEKATPNEELKMDENSSFSDFDQSNDEVVEQMESESESFGLSLDTSNLTSKEELSALALATLSTEQPKEICKTESETDIPKGTALQQEKIKIPPIPLPPRESELVQIEGSPTVVSEKDLADGQVEITSNQVISAKKPTMLSSFSMDFSDSTSDDNLADRLEFSKELFSKEIKPKASGTKKENAYERLELLDILEGNVGEKSKAKRSRKEEPRVMNEAVCDFEEHIPSQIINAKDLKEETADNILKEAQTQQCVLVKKRTSENKQTTASKLLERLTSKDKVLKMVGKDVKINKPAVTTQLGKSQSRFVIKPKSGGSSSGKPFVLSNDSKSDKLKKPLMEDFEDVETFVIHKGPQKDDSKNPTVLRTMPKGCKAKILQQTIITPAGEIIQPTVNVAQTDDGMFDINSMPIVLSDEILTPESIEKMPIVLGGESQLQTHLQSAKSPEPIEKVAAARGKPLQTTTRFIKAAAQPQPTQTAVLQGKTIVTKSKAPRILQTKMVKQSPLLPTSAKPGKYIIVPQSAGVAPTAVSTGSAVSGHKFVAGKKTQFLKRSPLGLGVTSTTTSTTGAAEPSGNKIMIVTNQQGQQSRLLLTPAQQKMLGYQTQGVVGKAAKTIVKGNVMQKSVLAKNPSEAIAVPGTSGVQKATAVRNVKAVKRVVQTHQPAQMQTQKVLQSTSGAQKPQKTILIKNQHGQTVRKIQGTDDALLDKQVAEQLEAIKASAALKFGAQAKINVRSGAQQKVVRRSYPKKSELVQKAGPPPLTHIQTAPLKGQLATDLPSLTPFSSPKKDSHQVEIKQQQIRMAVKEVKEEPKVQTTAVQQDRPLNQLVIQDAVGYQTTITEGQILALPSETVDGQPQSYMLVTLDESGNITPLSNEALMSLDPNLGLGGDLSNIVLQIDQGSEAGAVISAEPQAQPQQQRVKVQAVTTVKNEPVPIEAEPVEVKPDIVKLEQVKQEPEPMVSNVEESSVTIPSTNGSDLSQQLIVTGDAMATQKLLESLDLANIIANADGNSILIQADGQQILINTNSDNQMLLSMNNEGAVGESTEGGGNPIFGTQSKSQDILAAALADTDVFQPDQHASQSKLGSQLSPNNALYSINVGNVLETSLTLSSPIMTPLEVPSSNSKKIPDEEADILTRVPKNVDLPITITDPNISQTVANQQASMMANELQGNLELSLPISEAAISYSLPNLDESDVNQKPFNSSMPLLTEDVAVAVAVTATETVTTSEETASRCAESYGDEGRFTLGTQMCSSLSEPPPEMFDMPDEGDYQEKNNVPSSLQTTPDLSDAASKEDEAATTTESSNEGSCEIPVQPKIVAKSLDLGLKRGSDDEGSGNGGKKCKFD